MYYVSQEIYHYASVAHIRGVEYLIFRDAYRPLWDVEKCCIKYNLCVIYSILLLQDVKLYFSRPKILSPISTADMLILGA